MPDFESKNERELDVVFNFPINRSDKSVYDLQNFEHREIQVPEDIIIENKYGSYHAVFKKEINRLIVVEKFTIFSNIISIDNYNEIYDFIDSIYVYKKNTAILIK